MFFFQVLGNSGEEEEDELFLPFLKNGSNASGITGGQKKLFGITKNLTSDHYNSGSSLTT